MKFHSRLHIFLALFIALGINSVSSVNPALINAAKHFFIEAVHKCEHHIVAHGGHFIADTIKHGKEEIKALERYCLKGLTADGVLLCFARNAPQDLNYCEIDPETRLCSVDTAKGAAFLAYEKLKFNC